VEEEGGTHLLRMRTVTEKGNMTFPVELFACEGERVVEHISVTSEQDAPVFNLSSGTYSIYAVCGDADFSKGWSEVPLMTGRADVVVDGEDMTAALVMGYAVAKLSVALEDVPATAEVVTVNVGELYAAVDERGMTGGRTTLTLPCHRNGELWVTDTVYVLPSCGNSVTLTIEHSDGVNSSVVNRFAYTYTEPLRAGCPYCFRGSYTSGISYAKVAMTLEKGEWESVIIHDFAFGEGAGKGEESGTENTAVYYVDELPAPCSAWEGHVVAAMDGEGYALLMSRGEWTSLTDVESVSAEIAAYKEGTVADWSVPTEEQALAVCGMLRGEGMDLNAFSDLFVTCGGVALKIRNSDRDVYYCEGGTREYNFMTKSVRNVTDTPHCLRLVKRVRFVKR